MNAAESQTIAERLHRVRETMTRALERAGRAPDAARLIAVSKGHPASSIREAYQAGQRDFGENYLQELSAKAEELADLADLRWHAIGSIQRNKAKDVCRVAHVVHTVDRPTLADELVKRAERPLDVLIEVNIGREDQKAGVAPEATAELAAHIEAASTLRLIGLMAIPPADEAPAATQRHFGDLRRLADTLRARYPSLVELSMGMSQDFELAIAEGATLVRVGTAIFGARSARIGPGATGTREG